VRLEGRSTALRAQLRKAETRAYDGGERSRRAGVRRLGQSDAIDATSAVMKRTYAQV